MTPVLSFQAQIPGKTVIVAPVPYRRSLNLRIYSTDTNLTESRPILAKKEAYSAEVGLPFLGFVKAYPTDDGMMERRDF